MGYETAINVQPDDLTTGVVGLDYGAIRACEGGVDFGKDPVVIEKTMHSTTAIRVIAHDLARIVDAARCVRLNSS